MEEKKCLVRAQKAVVFRLPKTHTDPESTAFFGKSEHFGNK
jgi:hypothetical protein